MSSTCPQINVTCPTTDPNQLALDRLKEVMDESSYVCNSYSYEVVQDIVDQQKTSLIC